MTFAKSILSLALLLKCICLTSSKLPVCVTEGPVERRFQQEKISR